MKSWIRTAAATIVCLGLKLPAATAQDFAPAVGVASGADEAEATQDAYYQAFRGALGGVLGDAAAAETGEVFRRAMERDFEAFRNRYFSADTLVRCVPQPAGSLCEVDGSIDLAALRVDATREISSAGGRSYTFIASAAETGDPRSSFVIDRLTGEFATYDHRILFGSSANRAIAENDANFSLAIYEADFSAFDFDPNVRRLTGALTVRFRLNDLQSGEALSVTPVAVSDSVPGDNPSALEALLVESLSERAAAEIARVVNSEVISYGADRDAIAQAEALASTGEAMFSLRLVGANRRDAATRERLRQIRDILSTRLGFSDVATDFAASTESEIVVTFIAAADFPPDTIIDALYAKFDAEPSFYADYFGGAEYEVSFQ